MKATACRGCGSGRLVTLHDFGLQPLAGEYPTVPESVRAIRRYPLDLTQCAACGLLQVVNLPPIEEVFHSDYRYSSSTVPGLVAHFEAYADWLAQRFGTETRVFEFGCNDGVLLERLVRRGFTCAGVDASDNVASVARLKGLSVSTSFLTTDFVRAAGFVGKFGLVTCSNVFAHIHDLWGVLESVRLLLADGGAIAIEVHDGELLCQQGQFDTIYHEHLTYFTGATLCGLLDRSGFDCISCDRTSMHGGGLRFLGRMRSRTAEPAANIGGSGVALATDAVTRAVARCRYQLHSLNSNHGPLTGYGAAGRSQMFINVTRSAALFDRVYDDSPLRQGRYIAGTDIPIMAYAGESGRCAVILAWNYAGDISARIRGNFEQIVTLLPEMRDW